MKRLFYDQLTQVNDDYIEALIDTQPKLRDYIMNNQLTDYELLLALRFQLDVKNLFLSPRALKIFRRARWEMKTLNWVEYEIAARLYRFVNDERNHTIEFEERFDHDPTMYKNIVESQLYTNDIQAILHDKAYSYKQHSRQLRRETRTHYRQLCKTRSAS